MRLASVRVGSGLEIREPLIARLSRLAIEGQDKRGPNPHNTAGMLDRLLTRMNEAGVLTPSLVADVVERLEHHRERGLYDAIRDEARRLGLGVQTHKLVDGEPVPWRWKI